MAKKSRSSKAHSTQGRWVTLIPAYGRDYKSAEDVLRHWCEGKDFRIADISMGREDGRYMSVRDAPVIGEDTTFKIRYNRLADFCLITCQNTQWKVVGTCGDADLE